VPDASTTLRILLDLTRRLIDERSLDSALRQVTEATLELLPGDHASIRVLDQTRTELLSGARSGSGTSNRPVFHRPGVGVAGWVVDRGEVARINDTAADDRFVTKPQQGFAIRSILAVPLWSAGEVVGVLATTSLEREAFSAEHEALACLLANCAVPPIERARLARLAVTDAQTMAYNHRFLIPGLQCEMDRVKSARSPLSMLLLDLDFFKRINDSYGHAAGDAVLRAFADAVRDTTRDDDVVVRRGGDEFVLILPGSGREAALNAAERIRAVVEQLRIPIGDSLQVKLTVSIGGATWNGSELPEELERRADKAMYEAKLHGRNRVVLADDDPIFSSLGSAAAATGSSAAPPGSRGRAPASSPADEEVTAAVIASRLARDIGTPDSEVPVTIKSLTNEPSAEE